MFLERFKAVLHLKILKKSIFFLLSFLIIYVILNQKNIVWIKNLKNFKLTAERAYYLQNDEKFDFLVFCLFYRLLIGKRYLLNPTATSIAQPRSCSEDDIAQKKTSHSLGAVCHSQAQATSSCICNLSCKYL